jgi:nitrogen-specific signal transduction histidine kinase
LALLLQETADALSTGSERVRVTAVAGTRPLTLDIGKLQVVFWNLMRNALEAYPDQAKARAEVRAEVTDPGPGRAEVAVTVEDWAGTMTQDRLAALRGAPAVSVVQLGATGSGLCLARGFLAGHEGRLEIRPSQATGTTAVVAHFRELTARKEKRDGG